ncbi:MAG TPA: DUF2281 domain-containing protein [Cyanobacteria bacterium UBA8803]|nr:DUF2281 domain-containing protein [Cyanobacteria bacterium UBA9273]HBL61067.1 DUF2281 domain-containing protein [Cyanobacteria bacterium UBA8803]
MLNPEQLTNDIATLPQEAQKMVIAFVNFLKQQYQQPKTQQPQPLNFKDEPFVGMWSDRTDMQDSTAWVRQLRQKEWQN